MKTRLFFKLAQETLFVTAIWGIGAATAHAAACNVPTDHPTIQSAVSDPGCDPINVASGPYVENVIILRSLTLIGAQPGPVAGRTFGVGESTITGMITIAAANVTIDVFSLTNLNQSTGILIKTAGSGALIVNNIIDGIGGPAFAGNTQAIYLEYGPDNVIVRGNRISHVEGTLSSNGGIFIGDSTSADASLNILIEGNSISDIHSVFKGTYAIHVNNGASAAPSATGYTTGFVVRCCVPAGNLEYNDHSVDVRIKAESIDGLSISSPGLSCPTTPGSKHATFGGTASVIRPTGTTTEPFTVDVDDCGEPGTADTFGIKTTTYSNGPNVLTGGNIQIH